MKTYTIEPCNAPYVWSIRDNWNYPNGMFYDTVTGSVYFLSYDPYVSYIGRIPVEREMNKQIKTLVEQAYLAGFMESGYRYNGDYPFYKCSKNAETNKDWYTKREKYLNKLINQQPISSY